MTGEQKIYDYIDVLASKAPVPGGGGASALGGVLAAALGQMTANLTIGKERYADVEQDLQECLFSLNVKQMELLALADRDAEVFEPLARAYGMPKDTPEQQAEKEKVMEENLLAASLVPIQIMDASVAVIETLAVLEKKGSRIAVSDVGVAVQFARAALTGAVMNVYINTRSMKNRECAGELNDKATALLAEGIEKADAVYARVVQKLAGEK